ncbi:MAG TPA: hypothetical protein VEA69_11480 [Tepidisphaeraceae bacterium]|nr:hypothetical protein [Tepidisphaeraceae bacterium]
MRRVTRILVWSLRAAFALLAMVTAFFGVRSYVAGDVVSRSGYASPPAAGHVAQQFWSHKGKVLFYVIETDVVGDAGGRPSHPQEPIRVRHARTNTAGGGWGPFVGTPRPGVVDRWSGFNAARVSSSRRVWRSEFGPPKAGPNATQVERLTLIGLPHWCLFAAFAAWPTLSLWRWRRARNRVTDGRCGLCGYDLRAGHIRCPECGNPVATSRGAN